MSNNITVSKFGNYVSIPQNIINAIDEAIAQAAQNAVQIPGSSFDTAIPVFDGTDTQNIKTTNVKIDGDDKITTPGDILCANLDVTDTLTANTIITNIELEVKDPIITMGVDNPANLINSGILTEYHPGVKRWSGMLRDPGDGDFIFIRDMTTKPAPDDDLIATSAEKEGRVVCNRFKARGINAGFTLESTEAGGITHAILNQSGDLRLTNSLSQNVIFIDGTTDDVSFPKGKLTMNGYTLPTSGTTFSGHTIINDGLGNCTWQQAGAGDFQTLYNNSTEPQIETDAVNPKLVIQQGSGSGHIVFDLLDSG